MLIFNRISYGGRSFHLFSMGCPLSSLVTFSQLNFTLMPAFQVLVMCMDISILVLPFRFDFQTEKWHIAASEFMSIVLAPKIWGKLQKGLNILVRSDNSACVSVINTGWSQDKWM